MPTSVYDDLDLLYREIWGKSLHHGLWITGKETPSKARQNLIDDILHHWKPHGHIADIGCGYGILAHRLIHAFHCTVTACTSSTVQAAAIQKSSSLKILSGDWLSQNIPAHSLDGAIALESTSHFPHFDAFLKNAKGTLKPGAPLLISDWFSNHGNSPLLRHLAKSGDLPPWRSLSSFLKLAKDQGFQITLKKDLSPQVAPTWTALFWKALSLPIKSPQLLPKLIAQLCKRPHLLWTFPLLRLAYHQGDLSYHLIILNSHESLSTGPLT